MKKLIFIVILAIGCVEENVAPTPNSIEGWWNFSHKESSGRFELVDYGDITVDNGPGNHFTIGNKYYRVLLKKEILGTKKHEIFLMNSNYTMISFYEVDYNKSFTELTAKYWTIKENGVMILINEPILITR